MAKGIKIGESPEFDVGECDEFYCPLIREECVGISSVLASSDDNDDDGTRYYCLMEMFLRKVIAGKKQDG